MIGFLFLMPLGVIAQIDPPNPCPDPALPDCPIDSNLYVLFTVAFFFAAKKAYDFKKSASSL